MRNKRVETSNIAKFLKAVEELKQRGVGEEGMGLLWGNPGEGKSTTVAYVQNQAGGVHLRARVTWTVTSMLSSLMNELGMEAGRYRDRMIQDAIHTLTLHPRPIFVDEADYLFRQTDMLDALRDVYDSARVPVILIGMEDMARRIRSDARSGNRFNRFERRITQWIEFKGMTLEDAAKVANDLCEVRVSDDLVEHLHARTSGNIGNVVIGLRRIERFGKSNGLDEVTLTAFGNRQLLDGDPSPRQ